MSDTQLELFETDPPKAKPQTYRELAERADEIGCHTLARHLHEAADIAERKRRTDAA